MEIKEVDYLKLENGEVVEIHQFDSVELKDGRIVAVLDIYKNPDGYEVEDVRATCSPDYDGDPSFSVKPDEIKRVAWTKGDPLPEARAI
jgi:hypothetical protein